MKARIKFRKYGVMRFIGHLDVMRFFQKAMRRAGIPIAFTGGYSPHMIMSFAQPLGVGVTSDGEYLDIELKEETDCKEAVRRLNEVMVEGIEVTDFVRIPDDKKSSGMTIVAAASYRPMIYQMNLKPEGIYLFLAAGSEQNLKPDLVMEAFMGFLGEDFKSVPFHYHRIDVYARQPGGKNKFAPLN